MSRMSCKCGNILSNVETPNDIQLVVYTDREWEEKVNIGYINSVEIPLPKYDIWRCPTCERIYVFSEGSNKALRVYAIENN